VEIEHDVASAISRTEAIKVIRMSVFSQNIWNQILDGQKRWEPTDNSPNAQDRFELEVVSPLRELRDEGRIEIEEVKSPSPGQYRVTCVFLKEVFRLEDNP
jgi:hypothetical protein